ncbi:sensor domain-containing diguanylate cyclase [Robertmurraya korlensis]|uniref:sensor domain-containing diguanylate cyclase n=1 Tax=Robertmurraya korlensis TaxID=519977 RepID=UPI00082611CF|nr:GGDEF domain-containing protein [Robertmurraya korlensis]
MKLEHSFLTPDIPREKKLLLEEYLFKENMQRCKLFARIVILFEVILLGMNMAETYDKKQILVDGNTYFFLYLTLVLMASTMLLLIRWFEQQISRNKWAKPVLLSLVSMFLVWGAVVTLVDQREYGHVMAFVVNFMCVSILFHATNKIILAIYTPAILVLGIGLPMVQPSSTVVMGHFINLTVFLFFCWLASRMLYRSYVTNYISELLLKESNTSLAEKIKENEKMNVKLKELSMLDELTGISNRRGFYQYIESTLVRSHQERPLSILMMDIDAFKPYNDHYGHLQGDQVIQAVGKVLTKVVDAPSSIAARFGGEEFIVAVFDMEEKAVRGLAEEIRNSVEGMRLEHGFSPVAQVVTVSIGYVTGTIMEEEGLKQLIEQADLALYRAKEMGRNQVGTNQVTV